ncbi:pitrilysin family protein [Alkalinema sp. FACHB-956]|uniref:M16 family metallopeptidase n=1 Tax=Alkalinema sp. FACHB-956 TaxID=2692768 RepID=UPI001F54DC10|nr:pitrilysin family protein [Alkalinema sp. FACHB-956]
MNLLSLPIAAPSAVSRVCLDNGLTLIHHQMTATDAIAVDVWVKAGAILEPDDASGMAHFLEHMIFKGSDRLLPGDFDAIIENHGGTTNAATGQDYAHFFLVCGAHALGETLPCLAELLLNAAIPDEEFEREREVVFEEMRQAYDSPDWLGFQALLETVYQRHAYGRSILGTTETLMRMTPERLRQFHRSRYQPEHMTVVITGNLSQAEAIQAVSQAFHTFPTPTPFDPYQPDAEPPIVGIRRQVLQLPQAEQARLMLAWIAPGSQSKRDRWSVKGLDLLSVLLTEGRTSRLVRELREERNLVLDVSAAVSMQQDSSIFTITAWLDPEDLDRVEAIIGDRLSELTHAPITPTELNRAKRLICNDHAFSSESPSQIASLYGYNHTLAELEAALTYPDDIRSFVSGDLCNIASQFLSPYHYAAVIVRPE